MFEGLTERGMLRPSFVPPAEIRQLRDYTRLRTDLAGQRTRHYSRVEKLLEDALIKVSAGQQAEHQVGPRHAGGAWPTSASDTAPATKRAGPWRRSLGSPVGKTRKIR
jgi:hypothetical protein